ncbi:sialidase family protein [Micromonospora sp. NPDC050686]|uniref:sialidase family protein n=1 Tax=Micromonospora sp. NPDC050686 TaxID=3154631 RepID=UPI0033EC9D11
MLFARPARLAVAAAAITALFLPLPALAAPNNVWTFNKDTLGAPPPQASLVQGDVRVVQRLAGPADDQAIQLDDASTTLQSRVVFPGAPVEARRFNFDLAVTGTQPSIIAIHGQGDNGSLGLWRFLVSRSSISSEYLVSAYDGKTWRLIGPVSGIDQQYAQISVEATTTEVVLAVGDRRLKTTRRASAATAVTGIEFASNGAAPAGTGLQFDNLALKDTKPRAKGLEPTLAWNTNPERGQVITDAEVATVNAQPALAEVNWGNDWEPATVTEENRTWVVRTSHTFNALGRTTLRVRVTDTEGVTTEVGNIINVGFAKVLVASETAPLQIRFPDVTRRSDGALVVVYYASPGHTRANGVIKVTTSTDNGATWSSPTTAVQTRYDARDPKITTLSDGTLLVSYFETVWNTDGTSYQNGVFTTRSRDGGATWDTPTHVDSALGTTGPRVVASHGAPVQLANGDVLLPLYGNWPGETQWRATVIRSTDGGRTFTRDSEVTLAADPRYKYAEPNLTVLPSGEVISGIRIESPDAWLQVVRSHDNGRTWSQPEITDIPARSHHQLLTSQGRLLMTYGNPLLSGRPTEGRMIDDPAATWSREPATLIYDSGNGDQANPSSIELSAGRYLTLGYNVNTSQLFGVLTTDADYR